MAKLRKKKRVPFLREVGVWRGLCGRGIVTKMGVMNENYAAVRAITSGSPHFFGYYDKCPWSADGGRVLAMRAEFQDRAPTVDDRLMLGVVRLSDLRFEPFAQTSAWNWQQGTMLQWLPDGEVIFNDRDSGGRLISVICDPSSGRRRELPRAVYAVHPGGHEAICLDYHRLQSLRPGYGYRPAADINALTRAPDDVGLWRLDLRTGDEQLILSIAEAAQIECPAAPEAAHWFNHATYNTDGSRLCFLHRYADELAQAGKWRTRLFTLRSDGSGLYLLNGRGMTSHFAWRDPSHLIAWTWKAGPDGENLAGYWLMTDESDDATWVGKDVLTRDGHMTYSPDGRWLLTDEYPSGPAREQPLLLFNPRTGARAELGRFAAPLSGELRCDLHPRWNRDGTAVCFDSAHSGTRQVYIADVSRFVAGD